MVRVAKLSEALPLRAWRRQAKANLAPPTASFEGKTILFVGATGLILSDAARIIADLEVSTLIFGVRNTKKGEMLADELRQKHGDRLSIIVLEVDLLSFGSVQSFAAEIINFARINVIMMGSAIMNTETRMTKDGWEETLQLAHLSSALLIILLLPRVLAGGEERPVVLCSVSSSAIRAASPMVELPATPKDSYIEKVNRVETPKFQKQSQYGVTKIVHACWIRELCSYLPSGRVHFHQLDPGACFSPLSSQNKSAQLLLRWIGRPVEMCARTVVNACLPIDGSHGKLLVDYDVCKYPKYMDREAGIELRQRSWNETKQILIDFVPETESVYDLLASKLSS